MKTPRRRLPVLLDRWLLLIALVGAAGLATVLLFHDRGVPIAAIDFRVLQPGAEDAARRFLEADGIDLTGFGSAVSFETDRDAQGYLERTAGPRELDRIAAGEVTIWRWRVRFFRELDPLEYAVSVRPDGQVVGWSRTLAEAAPGATLDEPAARILAETALRNAGRTLDGWTSAGVAREARPNRLDYRFTWERDGWKVGDATIRQTVVVQGDRVGGWFDFLKTPEAWVRALRIETNRGIVLANAGWLLTYALGLAAAIVFLVEWRAGRTRRGVPLVLAGGFAAVGLAALLNQLPLWVASAPTTATVAAYLFGQARDQIGQLGPSLLAVAVAGAAGFAIWPRAFPALPNPLADFSPAALTSRRFVTAVIFSYLAAGAWLGYFTLYYWIGTTFFGVWSPVELPFRDVMSGAFPPAFPLFVGAGAAIAEEVVFRLFAIPAGVLALTWIWQRQRGRPPGSRARTALLGVVIVVVAAVWGSLHSTYPQLPFFVRALEVTIIGIFAGLVLLRWGLVATMLTHYVGNTSIVGALFFLSGNAVLQGAALLIIALPLLLLAPAAISVVRGRPLADLPLQPVIVSRQPTPAPPRTVVERPAGAWWPALLVVGALGVVAAFIPPRPTDGLRMALTREGAIALASSRAAQAGAPDGWPLVVADVIDTSAGLEATYLLRTVGPSETARFYQSELPPAIWQVRFLRPLEKDEVAIQLDPVGELVGIVRQVEEAAPGESPSIEEARAIAERWLGELSGRRDWMLVSQSQTRRERRLDSSFVWQRPGWKAGEATLRTQVLLYGDALGAYQPFLKVPETFVRQLRQDTGLEGLVRALRDLGLVAGAAVLGVVFLRAFRGWEANLAFGGALALAAALAGLLVLATSVPAVLAGFITTLDLPTFAVWTITGRLREGLFLVAGVVAVGALAPALLGRAGRRIRPASGREIILGALGALGLAVGSYAVWTIQAFVAPATLRPPGGLPPFEMLPPALFTLGAAIQSALGVGLGVAVLLLLLDRLRPTPRLVLAALAGALYLAANGVGPAEIAIGALLGAVGGLLLLGFWRAVGPSLWIPPIAVGGALLLRDMVGLIVLGDAGWYLSNGIAIPLLAFVLGGVLARRTRQPGPSSAPETRQ